ncbi:PTS mannose transporter subunit IIAB [Bombilactobacillus bombi]|uniref:PTS transporter subunit EIIC n=1 Tax=Bombilactobacillus bombi TaxID=1303590 RepID=UPI000E56A84C|nr:PTS transporter subunit EIIC [Bombilactobacillus bombi]AXX64407.1 PTS mannose transporter subunit IIAB [Bombilactobacillus bombi]
MASTITTTSTSKRREKFRRAFEMFGRSFLLPVSVLPAAGILQGLGSAFTNPDTVKMYPWMANHAFQFVMGFLSSMGSAAFNNLPVIFAVGVAVGLAKHEKGSAAVSGLLGFLTLHVMLNFLLTSTGKLVNTTGMNPTAAKLALADKMQTSVLGIQTMDLNVFGGIIVGVIVYFVHKHAIKMHVPKVLDFFSGPRLVPILIMPAMSLAAVVLFFVWPTVQTGISALSVAVLKSGTVGTFFYGVIERLLLPFGLHHGLNWPVRTTALGGVFHIAGQEYQGTIAAYMAALAHGGAINPMITRFSSGKFVYNMFGLPAAALAMYSCARPENKKRVGSLLLAAAATSFLTGITEPIEFTFLFVAPALYGIHAILVGITMAATSAMGAAYLTPTGHGLINFIIYGVLQGPRTHWWIMPLAGVFCAIMYYFVFRFAINKFDFQTPGREIDGEITLHGKEETRQKMGVHTLKDEQPKKESSNGKMSTHNQAIELIKAHGGPDNIVSVDACITRLRIDVKNKNLVDSQKIVQQLGAMGFSESGMQMQSIYGGHANVLKMEIQDMLGLTE